MDNSMLFPADHPVLCSAGSTCEQAVVHDPERGRWFITFGHAGFNCRANNGMGFLTKAAAIAAIRRYTRTR